MAFPVASSSSTPPIYPAGSSGNTLQATGFIPQIWSGKLIEKFYASTVLAAISNTDYEGEIKNQGDTVKIRAKPTITINNYSADGALSLQRPSGSEIDLAIDQGRYFNTILDDVMEVQSDLNVLSIWSDDAAQQMKINIDTDVLSFILNGAAAANRGTTAGAISGSINLGVTSSGPLAVVPNSPSTGQVDILDVLMRLGNVLDEQNIPEVGRWVVLPAWAAYAIKRSELRQAYITGDSVSVMRNGRLGMVDRFTLYISNLLPHGTAAGLQSAEWVIYAGHAHGLTFASQIVKVETLRSEMVFGTILRGLQVYGRQILASVALTQAIVTKAF